MYVLDLMDVDCGGTVIEHRIGSQESFRSECEARGITYVDSAVDSGAAPEGAIHLVVVSSSTSGCAVSDTPQSLRNAHPSANIYIVCEVAGSLMTKLRAAIKAAGFSFRRRTEASKPLQFSQVRGEVYADGLFSTWSEVARGLSVPRRLKEIARRARLDAARVAKLDYILYRL